MMNRINNLHCFEKMEKEIDLKIKTSLICLGFDFSTLGAQYLKDIIIEILKCPKLLHSLVTDVYEIVSQKHNTTRQSVERVTRLAVIKAHKHGLIKEISCFGKDKPPTIKQLVNFMYDYFVEFDYII